MKQNPSHAQNAVMSSDNKKPELKLDWCSHEAAKYAVEHWHYSQTMPAGKLSKVGVWENGAFIGCVLFGRGANNNIASAYKLKQDQCCELVRIALTKHKTPVTKIVSIALKFLKKQSPGLTLIVSYADPEQGHHGGIYQAGNWFYVGKSHAQREVIVNGKIMHKRTANSLFGTIRGLEKSKILWKHKYLMPLNDEMLNLIKSIRQPHPKRASSADSGTSGSQPEWGGANPTDALQSSRAVSIGADAPAFQAGEGGSTPTTALQSDGEK